MTVWTERHDRAAEIVREDFPSFDCDDPDVHERRHGRYGECDCPADVDYSRLVDAVADGLAAIEELAR